MRAFPCPEPEPGPDPLEIYLADRRLTSWQSLQLVLNSTFFAAPKFRVDLVLAYSLFLFISVCEILFVFHSLFRTLLAPARVCLTGEASVFVLARLEYILIKKY